MSAIGLLVVVGVVLGAPAVALHTRRRGELITPRPYNNPYAEAAGARDPLR